MKLPLSIGAGATACLMTLVLAVPRPILAKDLVVAAGQTRTIQKSESDLVLQNWVMEDNSTLLFEPGVDHWSVVAKTATFGEGVTINGVGSDGADGKPGNPGNSTRTHGKSGDNGAGGEPGVEGARGIDLNIIVGLKTVGGVEILTSGGAGGDGGKGGKGGDGGRAKCYAPAGHGGHGGAGGNAGGGGDGGNIKFVFKYLSDTFPNPGPEPIGISFVSDGGKAGRPGGPGAGGKGGGGKSCPPYDYSRGSSGHQGGTGGKMPNGSNGTISTVQDTSSKWFEGVQTWVDKQ